MSDKILGPRVLRLLVSSALAGLFAASPALAGSEVLYGGTPGWVEPLTLDAAVLANPGEQVIYDTQYRLEDGVVRSYVDSAVRITSPDTLTEEGSIALTWSPDKGDITIHRVEILRDGQLIDVIASGAKFDVLRREQGLEQRLLDGQLTATLAVPGLKVGDVLRVTHSATLADQALGKEMQVTQYLPTLPWQVGKARTLVSWPVAEPVLWRGENIDGIAQATQKDGYHRLEVALPLAKPVDMPSDAPSRFRRDSVLRIGTFADWQEMSRTLYPAFDTAAALGADSPVAREAAAIMRRAKSPLERAALALQLVQDDVSYLLNGLDGGNYLPQTAADTWDKRYGDCKAKSVLLLALLRQMGIAGEPLLVVSRGGDALPELLPIPADFDHMIVRATIDGTDYWLDGTSAGTRLANIGEVPPFFHALPLTESGATLVPMTQRPQPFPDMEMTVAADYSAGIDLPYVFAVDVAIYGAEGAGIRRVAEQADPAVFARLARNFAGQDAGGNVISSVAVEYDKARGAGIIRLTGVSDSDFEWKDGRLQSSADSSRGDIDFSPDRARSEWRDIPVFTPGPNLSRMKLALTLPDGAGQYALTGTPELDSRYGNTRIVRTSRLNGRTLDVAAEVSQGLGEIAPDQIGAAKLAARRLASEDSNIVAPIGATRKWERSLADLRKRTAKVAAGYDAAVSLAQADDFGPLGARARFYREIYDYEKALADYDTLVAKTPSAGILVARASTQDLMGKHEAAIADLRRAYDLEPDTSTALYLAQMLAYAGQASDALALLEAMPVSDDEQVEYASALATVSGLGGDTGGGLETLASAVSAKPQNAALLNADCWFRGLFNVALDDALARCTHAVERAEDAAAVLDSRAMVRYRLGQYDAALADLDAALALAPGLAASRYLRGIVRLEKGETAGREDVAAALRMQPELAARYARHGVEPKG